MADNVIADPGAGGATFAADDIAGVHYPRTKVVWGQDGTATDTADATNERLPVNIGQSIAIPVTDNGGSLTVDGTVAVTNAGLTELASAINASGQMDVNLAASAVTIPVSHTGLTELAAAINVSSQMDVNLVASAATLTVASHAVTNAGTFATQASQSGTWNVGTVTTITNVVHVDDNASTLSVDDNGGSLTVDGTVAVTNAGLTELAAAINASAQVDVNIAASGATLTVGSHAVTNAGTFAVQAAQSGTWNVGTVTAVTAITNALPAGTNNIGDVDVLSVVPGTAATNLGKAEDAVHTTGDVGVMALAVRQTSQVSFGGDGDYVPLSVDDAGGVRVSIVAGAGSGGTAAADDADFTAGVTQGTPAMGVYESAPSSVTNGDLGTVGITQTRALRTVVEGTAAVSNAGTFATQAAQAGTWTVQPGNTANTTPWLASIHDGTTKASIADLTNSNPLHVAIVDADGTQIASFGGGTQYTEDAAAAANPVGTALVLVREDARAGSLTTTDGDNVAARGTNAGELYVKHVDAIPVTDNAGSLTVDGTVAATQSGTWNIGTVTTVTNVVHVDDNAGTLSIDDGGGIITVDGTVAVTNGGLTELATAINASSQMDVNLAASAVTLTVAAHAVTNAGTFVVQENGAALTALQLIDNTIVADDAAFTPGTTSVTMAGFEFDDTTPDSVNEGDAGAARMSANRNIYTTIRDAAGNERGVNVNASSQLAVSVDNTVTVASHAVTNAGTFAVQATLAAGAAAIAKAEDAASADLDVGVPAMAVRKATPANTSGTDGDYEMIQMSAGRVWVDPSGVTLTVASHAVTNAGTFAVQAATAGDIAHDAADSGNPLKIGAKATTSITGITAVANSDRTQLYAGTDGVLLVRENANLESLSRGTAAITDGSSTSVIGAAGAGIKTYITDVIISNSSATYVTVDIRDGTAGSVMATFPAPATSGCVHRVGSPIAGTANTIVAADPSAAATTVTVTLLGFKSLI